MGTQHFFYGGADSKWLETMIYTDCILLIPNKILTITSLFFQYSDADIVLSKDWVPPITIAPTHVTESESPARKKNSSVSFSLDSSSDADPTIPNVPNNSIETKEETDKTTESRKNKVRMFFFYLLFARM